MLTYLLALAVVVSGAALLYARWEYRRNGSLTIVGLFLLCAMLFVPNVILDFATTYEMPGTALDYAGVIVAVAGLALCLVAMVRFRSITKILCLNPGELTSAGPYRWSRNPQYVGWLLFLVGFALYSWSLWCLGAILVVAVSLHLLVLVEEEHLRRVFGESYEEFLRRTPRYVGRKQRGS